jgi:glycosyltransferase involved in cell wall biosynthesis
MMRVLLSSDHRYPSGRKIGVGLNPKAFPSGSGYTLHDLLAKGLAELGHDVSYLLRGIDRPLPPGVRLVSKPTPDADVLHTLAYHDERLIKERQSRPRHWVATCHLDLKARDRERSATTENWIFVSRTLARLHGRDRYVLNGIDPSEYIFSETKGDYFLFMSTMDWELKKGLDVVLSLSKRLGFRLVVAGTGADPQGIENVAEMCREVKAEYVGDVRGKEKAELLAGARGFLFPTKVDEAFGLGMAEALMSGTPVICSDKGACPEIISPDVGFVCRDEEEYVAAINRVSEISPRACREKAFRDYHYLRMASDYVVEYQKEIARDGN